MKNLIFVLFVIILLQTNFTSALSQSEWVKLADYRNYNKILVEQIVNSVQLNPLIKDSKGNLWFYSKYISKYDGSNIISFDKITSKRILKIVEDSKGNLWFSAEVKLFRFDTDGNWTSFDKKDIGTMIIDMIEDNEGNMWFLHYGGGVTKYDGQEFTNYSKKTGLGSKWANSITKNNQGNIIVVIGDPFKDRRIMMFQDNEWTKLSDLPYQLNKSYVASNGTLWLGGAKQIGGNGGFVGALIEYAQIKNWILFNYSNHKLNVITDSIVGVSKSVILPNKFFEDSKGNMWFAMKSGLFKFGDKKWESFSKIGDMRIVNYTSIIEDKDNNIWVAFWGFEDKGFAPKSYSGVAKYNGDSFSAIIIENAGNVLHMLEGANGFIWVLTEKGIYYFKDQ